MSSSGRRQHLDLFANWAKYDNYFDDLAVFAIGSLHPGGLAATRGIVEGYEWSGKRVLDIGSGNGTTLLLLGALGADALGVERSALMREAALQNGVPPAHLIAADIERLTSIGLGRHQFNVVLFEGVLGFIENSHKLLKEVVEYLAAEGQIFICDWVPHARSQLPQYGFTPYGNTDPGQLETTLCLLGFRCTRQHVSATARAFRLDLKESIRRAEVFFPHAPKDVLRKAVARKRKKLTAALAEDIATESFILAACANLT